MDALLIWFGLLAVAAVINTAGTKIADAIMALKDKDGGR